MRRTRSPLVPFAVGALLVACQAKTELEPKVADKAIEAAVEDPWLDAIGSEEGGELAPPPTPAEQATAAPELAPEGSAPEPAQPQPAKAETTDVSAEPAKSPTTPPSGDPAPITAGSQPSEASPPAEPEPAPEDAQPEPAAEPSPPEPEPTAPPPITLADFDGSYHYVGGSKQREQLEQAIEDTAQTLPGVIRGIGRKRLTKTNQLDKSIRIDIDGDRVTTTYASGFNPSATLGAGQITWTSKKGDKYRVKVQQKGSKLIQIAASEDGVKTTVFVLSADRQRLTVHHKIVADRLPEPMTYRLSYARD